MTRLTLENVPEELHRLLRESAQRNGRSLDSEILVRLEGTFSAPLVRLPDFGRALRSFTCGLPEVEHAEVGPHKRHGRP